MKRRDHQSPLDVPSRRGPRADPLGLDADTAERILRGAVAPDDAPPGYQKVAEMVAALNATPTSAETQPSRYAFSAESPRPRSVLVVTPTQQRIRQRHGLRGVSAAVVSGVLVFSGLAAAGAVPRSAQQVTADVVHQIGVSIPAPESPADTPTVGRTPPGSNARSGGATAVSADDRSSSATPSAPNGNARTSDAGSTIENHPTPVPPAGGRVDETKPPKEPKGPNDPPGESKPATATSSPDDTHDGQ